MSTHAKPVLLVLGGGTDQLFMLETARAMGLGAACLDGNPDAPGLRTADLAAPIDFSDLPAVFTWIDAQRAGGVNLAGVSTMGSDVPHLLAAIGERYGWPAPSRETGALATDKLAMKIRFKERSVPVPLFLAVDSAAMARECWNDWGCDRVVIKPTDRAGSRGVRVLADPDALPRAFAHARQEAKSGRVILEEFVPGPQVSTETIIWQGRPLTCGFADRLYEGMEVLHPQIMENGGWLPSRFAGTPLQKQIERLVESAASALGVASGVAKGDVVVCPRRGPMVIEMAARLSGGDFSAGLVPLGTGVNYVAAVITMALGREPDWSALVPSRHLIVANRYFFPPPGRLEAVEVPAELAAHPQVTKLEITRTPGEILPVIASHGDRAGVMVVTGNARSEVQGLIDEVYDRVRFRIGGHWHQGRPGVQAPRR